MPYITIEARDLIDSGTVPRNAGELNYAISMHLICRPDYESMRQRIRNTCDAYILGGGWTYQRMNDVVGALISAGFEFTRRTGDVYTSTVVLQIAKDFYDRVAVPYEIKKIQANGDLPYVRLR